MEEFIDTYQLHYCQENIDKQRGRMIYLKRVLMYQLFLSFLLNIRLGNKYFSRNSIFKWLHIFICGDYVNTRLSALT